MTSAEPTVEHLFRRFRRTGRPRDLAVVYDRVAPELLLLAVHLGRGEGDAEDLLQETFVAAIESVAHWDPERPLLPWLLGILGNRARRLRHERGRRLDASRLDLGDPTADDPVRAAVDAEFAEEFARKLSALPAGYREVLTLRWVHGLTPTQIGHSLGVSIETVKTRLRRGTDILRRALPAGFAAAALAAFVPARDLASVREAVLRAAVAAQGARTAALLVAGLKVGALVVLIGAAAVVGWQVLGTDSSTPTAPPVRTAGGAAADDGVDDARSAGTASIATPVRSPLEATGSVRVAAVRFTSGEPVPGAVVLARPVDETDPDLRELRTIADQAGVARLDDLTPGCWELRSARGGREIVDVVADGATIELVVPDGVDVTGRVRDGERPLTGARIWLSRAGRPDEGLEVASTDTEGRFALRAVEPGRALSVVADGYSPLPMVLLPAEVGARTELDLDLAGDRSGWELRGQVVDASGAPIPAARIQLGRRLPHLDFAAAADGRDAAGRDARVPPLELVSDAEGRFARRGFTIHGGVLDVWVRAADHAGWHGEVAFARGVPAPEQRIVLEPGRVIEGLVRGDDGVPVVGAMVAAAPADATDLTIAPSWSRPSAITADDGSYRLRGVTTGTARLTATAANGHRASATLDGPGSARWDAVLRAPTAITGFVVDPRGAPIAGVQVRGLVDAGRTEPAAVNTDARGGFVLDGCDELEHTLWVTDPGSPWTGRVAAQPSVRRIDGAIHLTIPDHLRSTATLRGRIVDQHGQPAVADLALGNLRVGRTFAKTDADGRFEIGPLPALGHWDLFVRDDQDRWACRGELTTSLDAVTELGDVELLPAGRIAVRVTADDGAPIGRVVTRFVTSDGLVCDAIELVDGKGRSAALSAGDYVVTFAGDVAMTPTPIRVVAGETVELAASLPRGEPVVVELEHPDDGWDLRARITWTGPKVSTLARDFVQLPRGRPARLGYRLVPGIWQLAIEAHSGRRGGVAVTVPQTAAIHLALR